MRTPGELIVRQLTMDREINGHIATMIDPARREAPRMAEVIPPLARIMRARVKAMRGKVEVYEMKGELLCACRVTLERLFCDFSWNEDRRAVLLYGHRRLASAPIFSQMLSEEFRKPADIKDLAWHLMTAPRSTLLL